MTLTRKFITRHVEFKSPPRAQVRQADLRGFIEGPMKSRGYEFQRGCSNEWGVELLFKRQGNADLGQCGQWIGLGRRQGEERFFLKLEEALPSESWSQEDVGAVVKYFQNPANYRNDVDNKEILSNRVA